MKKLSLIIVGLFALLCMSACKRDSLPFLGPAYCPTASFVHIGSFKVPDSIDFTKGTKKLSIKDTLSESLKWTVNIKGLSTGATKTFTGTGSIVNVDWFGDPGTSTFFSKEECSVTLELPCVGVITTRQFKIVGSSDFSQFAYLAWNFEKETPAPSVYGLVPDGEVPGEFTAGLYNFPSKPALITPSPQGGGYFNFSAHTTANSKGVVNPAWYFGSLNGAAFNATTVKALVAKTSLDPDSVYFNCFVNTNGKPLSQIYFQIVEKTATGTFNRVKTYDGNFEGWKFISFKLSEIGVESTSNLQSVNVLFQASPVQAYEVEVNIDMPLFTKGKPFLKN